LGKLGVDATSKYGFDISGVSGFAYASINRTGVPQTELYGLLLGTGFPLNRFGSINTPFPVKDLAAPMLDVTAPTLSFLSPTNGRVRTTRGAVNINGTATDNLQISAIKYRKITANNTSEYFSASGSADWSISLKRLPIGKTKVEIIAVDLYGNESVVNIVQVNRVKM
jgi:subtilisin family serine protease